MSLRNTVIWFALLANAWIADAKSGQVIRDGFLDLSTWNAAQSPVIELSGDWEFYWSQLLEPSEFAFASPKGSELLRVPGGWYRHSNHPKHGYATYRLRVKLDLIRDIAFSWPTVWSASRIYLDGVLIDEKGIVGTVDDPKTYKPGVRNGHRAFRPKSTEFDIVIHASSFEFFSTGLSSPPQLGTVLGIQNMRERSFH